jgi:hypothetical protein
MCSPMLTVQAAPTSASIMQGTCRDISPPVQKCEAEFHPLHMNWLWVDDKKGNHRAQMQWVVGQ